MKNTISSQLIYWSHILCKVNLFWIYVESQLIVGISDVLLQGLPVSRSRPVEQLIGDRGSSADSAPPRLPALTIVCPQLV